MEPYHEESTWQYLPGLLELVEEGAEPDEIEREGLFSQRVRGGISQLDRVVQWLRGFRCDRTLCTKEPIWVPIVDLWPPLDGSLEFSYELAQSGGLEAEIRVFAVGGFGGGSFRTISSTVRMTVQGCGRALLTRSYVTVHRYVNQKTNEELYRVDVDCAGQEGEYRNVDLELTEHPFQKAELDRRAIRDLGYMITETQLCREVAGETRFLFQRGHQRSWTFEVGLEIPAFESALKFGATCQRAQSFEAEFTLAGGRDYAFCSPIGEAPVVPICVLLKN